MSSTETTPQAEGDVARPEQTPEPEEEPTGHPEPEEAS